MSMKKLPPDAASGGVIMVNDAVVVGRRMNADRSICAAEHLPRRAFIHFFGESSAAELHIFSACGIL